MESVEYVLVVTPLCRTLSVMSRNVTQRINERVEENHIKDSQTIPYDDLRRAKRRHSKHFRVQVISLKKIGILSEGGELGHCHFVSILAKMFASFSQNVQDTEETIAH